METDPGLFGMVFRPVSYQFVTGVFVMIFLLFLSALISASQVAFFALTPNDTNTLRESRHPKHVRLVRLLKRPQKLLATILITNNFVNILFVMLSIVVVNSIVVIPSEIQVWLLVVQVFAFAFIILVFGELMPRTLGNHYRLRFAGLMVYPLWFAEAVFAPLSDFLIQSAAKINSGSQNSDNNISINDLSQALDLSKNVKSDEKEILKGIVNFGNIEVKNIMTPRVDVVAADSKWTFTKLKAVIVEAGYSRIPVFEDTFDQILGVVYIKDLLPYIDKETSFDWIKLIRAPHFIPETKKINDLLAEFQEIKIHLAIVVDEYGGANGIITLEDVLEEIVGEMNDESDDMFEDFTRIDEHTFIFEGKTLLFDFYKIVKVNEHVFDTVRGDADTIAGLILELRGELPSKNEVIHYGRFVFKMLAVDSRRIRQLRVHVKPLKN